MDQNANFFPWDEISEDNVFPTGIYRFSIDELEDGMSGTGKRMFRARLTCKEPAEQAGMSHFENYVTGTEENPGGINAGTMGSRGSPFSAYSLNTDAGTVQVGCSTFLVM